MKAEIRRILQYASDHPDMTTRSAVVSYFDQFVWLLEKQEWEKMTDPEKQRFIDTLDAAKRMLAKEPECGSTQPF